MGELCGISDIVSSRGKKGGLEEQLPVAGRQVTVGCKENLLKIDDFMNKA
jgi:hypothetical protein